ncbi:hypothetical protein M3Y99_00576600 [Aphelenchoides fujianensis]|nr:hypothetical protein M3Y99_00576600 [Aphelenchoides fujianensis]
MSSEDSKRAKKLKRSRVLPTRKDSKDSVSSRRRRPSKKETAQPPLTAADLMPVPNVVESREGALVGSGREALRRFVLAIVRRGVEPLRAEFEPPKEAARAAPLTREAMDANLVRCRYKDVQCWDQTRVRLHFPAGNPLDFVHANWVRDAALQNAFICAMAPLDATVEDFWRLVWQERVCLILMLCQCTEGRKTKCAEYWPKTGGESKTVGPFVVTTSEVDTSDPAIPLTRMTLQCTYGQEARTVEHRQWSTWPDKSVPRTATAAFKLLLHPKETPNNPTLVHCSAGAGRTGTLILIEMVIRHVLGDARTARVVELLRALRLQRAQSVQTEDQFVFAHFALVQYALVRRALELDEVSGFVRDYEQYLKQLDSSTKIKGGKRKTSLKQPSDDDLTEMLPANGTPRRNQSRRRSLEPKKSKESYKNPR